MIYDSLLLVASQINLTCEIETTPSPGICFKIVKFLTKEFDGVCKGFICVLSAVTRKYMQVSFTIS